MSTAKCKQSTYYWTGARMEHKNQPFKCHLNIYNFNIKICTAASRELKCQVSLVFMLLDKYLRYLINTSIQNPTNFTALNFLLFQFLDGRNVFWHKNFFYLIFRSTPSTLKSNKQKSIAAKKSMHSVWLIC